MKTSTKTLWDRVGGLSNPSKMPGWSYGIPAAECIVGSLLRKIEGSVCSKCYAHKGMYGFPAVQAAQRRRFDILSADLESWKVGMRDLIERKYARKTGDDRVFRWHDSGDIQSLDHLESIVWIAEQLPDIAFWLPTKEYGIVRKYGKAFPDNLVVRVSAPKIGKTADLPAGTVGSTVGADTGFQCEAYSRGGECGPCRACCKKDVRWVNYPKH